MWFARAKQICAALIVVAAAGPAFRAERKPDAINSPESLKETSSTPASVRQQMYVAEAVGASAWS
jgi:hypothetical protein